MGDVSIEKPKNPTLRLVINMIVLAAMAILFFVWTAREVNNNKAYGRGEFEEEEATIVKYESNSLPGDITASYCVFYEFVDEDGHVYSGVWEDGIKREQDAKGMVGDKVSVFVNRVAGTSLTYKPDNNGAVIAYAFVGGFCAFGFLIAFLKEILYLVKLKAYKSAVKQSK